TAGSCAVKTRPPVAASPLSKLRRLTFLMTSLECVLSSVMSHPLGCGAYGRMDALITATSTEVARHGLRDLGIRRRRLLGQQGRSLHDLSGLTVAALRNTEVPPGNLQRMLSLRVQAFDRGHVLAGDRCHGRDAGAGSITIDMHGAGAAER